MKKIVNMCCDCATPGYPCRGTSCPLTRVEVHVCDGCGEELGDEIYDVDDDEFCADCVLDLFRRNN